jgi:GT2 family glycosyltransferase
VTIFSSTAEARQLNHTTPPARSDSRLLFSSEREAVDPHRQRRAILAALPSRTGRTLEISSDDGDLGAQLAERATVLVRLEPDRARARLLAAQGHARVRAGRIDRRFPLRHYDTVVCVGKLDEVPAREAPLVRERLVRSLTAGGILLLQHGPGADTQHPPFLDHGLETVSLDVLGGIETLVLRRRRAGSLADARQLLADLVREPWPAAAPSSHWDCAEADLETGRVVGRSSAQPANSVAPSGRRLLLRLGDRPATMVTAPGPRPSQHRVATELAPRVADHLVSRLRTCPREPDEAVAALKEGCRPPRHRLSSVPRCLEPGELIVGVCTSRGAEASDRLVRELAGAFDVIVSENGTDQPRLADMCAADGVAHDHDHRPGLAAARNRVLARTDARWVLFLDDDCQLGPGGGSELARQLGGAIDRVPDAGAIGGLVLPACMESAAEEEFERVAGHGRGFLPIRYDPHSSPDRWWPLRHGDWMAVGACLAVRRQAWEAAGGFDERLGAGTSAASAEDDEFLRAIVESGWSVFYDPAIVVRHRHRANRSALRRQLFGYGLGRSVHVLLRALDTRDWRILTLWMGLLAETWQDERPRSLRLGGAELLGYLSGPMVAMNTALRCQSSDPP